MAQVLQYAIEISDALDKAHPQGVTHRDLKPGNIVLTKGARSCWISVWPKLRQESKPGTPFSELATVQGGETAEEPFWGRCSYMAPETEWKEGRSTPARTSSLLERSSTKWPRAREPFEGRSQASLIAKILETDRHADLVHSAGRRPPSDRLVKKCMAKEPERRWQAASDVCDELKWIAGQGQVPQAATPASGDIAKRGIRERLGWLVAACAILVAVALAAAVFYFRRPSAELKVVHFPVVSPEKQNLPANGLGPNFFRCVSRRQSKVAIYRGGRQWPFPALAATSTPQPRSRYLGPRMHGDPFGLRMAASLLLLLVRSRRPAPAAGGPAETITASPANFGGTWNRDGVILFSPGPGSPILRVPSARWFADSVALIDLSQQAAGHSWPCFLPDGKHFLYTIYTSNPENDGIYVGSLDSKDAKLILKNPPLPHCMLPGLPFV